MTDTIATTHAVDKTALRADLERARDASRALISEIPEAKWDATSGNPDFTCGQLAWHLASAVDFAAGLIENALKGKQVYFPSVLMPVGNRINATRIRRGSLGYPVVSVPVTWRHVEGSRLRVRPQQAYEVARDLLRLRFRR